MRRRSWLKAGLFLLAAAMGVASVPAHAASVLEYYVTGTFNAHVAVAPTSPNFNQTDSLTVGDETLTYNNRVSTAVNGDHVTVFLPSGGGLVAHDDLGQFANSFSDGDIPANFTGNTFTLSIFQLQPNVGVNNSSTLVASMTGFLQSNGSSLTLVFNPSSTVIPPPPGVPSVFYTVSDPNLTINANGSGTLTTINGVMTAAPLPSTASVGLTMMAACGVVGMGMKLRRKEVVA
jgi:hypothetical protein